MKTCLICSHLSEVEAPHCIHCGEASWGEYDRIPTKPLPTVLEDEPESEVKPIRKGRKNG